MKCDKCGKELKPTVIGFNATAPEYYRCDCSRTGKQPEIDYSHPATPLIAEPEEEVLKTCSTCRKYHLCKLPIKCHDKGRPWWESE